MATARVLLRLLDEAALQGIHDIEALRTVIRRRRRKKPPPPNPSPEES